MSILDRLFKSSEDRMGAEEASAKSLNHFVTNEKGAEKQFSQLWLKEATWLATLGKVAADTGMDSMNVWCSDVLKLRVSTERRGRGEMVDVIKHKLNAIDEARKQIEADALTKARLGGE